MDDDARRAAVGMLDSAAAVLPHTDADGLAAGAIALRRRGEPADAAWLLGRGHNPFHADTPLPKGSLAILDQGVRRLARPAVFVDHHAPEADAGPGQIVVSGHGEEPTPSTSALMRRLLPEAPAWLAAAGAAGDYGDAGLKLPECRPPAGEKLVKTHVKKLVALVNAPRRLPNDPADPTRPHPSVRTALALLVEHADAKSALADPRIKELEAAKAEYRAGFDAAVRTAPQIVGDMAVIRFTSDYQVHPLVAQTWLRRLKTTAVLAANDDYLPGRVNFAVRTNQDVDLRRLLKDALPEQAGEYAHGHARATGGSLTPGEFDELLAALARRA